jgi:hypothetical protein
VLEVDQSMIATYISPNLSSDAFLVDGAGVGRTSTIKLFKSRDCAWLFMISQANKTFSSVVP